MGRTSRLFGLGVAALIGATACAMKTTPTTGSGCTITWAEKLPDSTVGADAICQRIIAAIASRTAASPPARIAVVVHSASRISATATLADGRMLPAQNVAIFDATLNERSLAILAEAVANQIDSARHD